jgi:hypothetical protein
MQERLKRLDCHAGPLALLTVTVLFSSSRGHEVTVAIQSF